MRDGQAIAVYTFCVLVLRWSIPRYISKVVVLMVWIFITLVVIVPYVVHMKERFYGNVGYCKSFIF
jgi:vacuolar-type H+-ATPase subunit I/STV1